MGERKKAVQRGVDGSRYGIVAEGAEGEHCNHLVFGIDAFVTAFEGQEFLLKEGGEAGTFYAAQIAAGALDPQDFDGFAGEWVGLSDFGTGVATGKVGDAEVGA